MKFHLLCMMVLFSSTTTKIFVMDSGDLPNFLRAMTSAETGKKMKNVDPFGRVSTRSLARSSGPIAVTCEEGEKRLFGLASQRDLADAKSMVGSALEACENPKKFTPNLSIRIPMTGNFNELNKEIEKRSRYCGADESKVSVHGEAFLLQTKDRSTNTHAYGLASTSDFKPLIYVDGVAKPYDIMMGKLYLQCP